MSSLESLLQKTLTDRPLTPSMEGQLIDWELSDESRSRAFGIAPDNASEIVQSRVQFLRRAVQIADRFPVTPSLTLLWRLWLPLAGQLAQCCQGRDRPLVQGILGAQGTGKTTLATSLQTILAQLGVRVATLSIDDFYKTYGDRQRLKQRDPRLVWRGPPGTHDIELGIATIDRLRDGDRSEPVAVPRFDKSAWNGQGDRAEPEWIEDVDLVILEGWLVGMRPIDSAAFDTAPSPIDTEGDREFARDNNERLRDYLPLWDRLDRFIVLDPVDYRFSLQWRQEAERNAIARGKAGMDVSQVEQFVKYFWKALHPELFVPPLLETPQRTDLAIEIQRDRSPGKIYVPS